MLPSQQWNFFVPNFAWVWDLHISHLISPQQQSSPPGNYLRRGLHRIARTMCTTSQALLSMFYSHYFWNLLQKWEVQQLILGSSPLTSLSGPFSWPQFDTQWTKFKCQWWRLCQGPAKNQKMIRKRPKVIFVLCSCHESPCRCWRCPPRKKNPNEAATCKHEFYAVE